MLRIDTSKLVFILVIFPCYMDSNFEIEWLNDISCKMKKDIIYFIVNLTNLLF